MSEPLPPEPSGGLAASLGTLRHALADPLSSAGLKLELLERRLAADPPGDPTLADRLRGARADLVLAGRLLDLLPRLAGIEEEAPGESSIGELCSAAGVPLPDGPASRASVKIRRLASVDAVRTLGGILGAPGRPASAASALSGTPGRLFLRIEGSDFQGGPRRIGGADLERIFHLPRGVAEGEELFLARAGIEAGGGRLRLLEEAGRLVAELSWPEAGAS